MACALCVEDRHCVRFNGTALYYQLQDPVYRNGVYATAVWYALGLLYFATVGRHRLVLSPEEKFALSGGKSAH